MDVPYYAELIRIRTVLEQVRPGFPLLSCEYATFAATQALPNLDAIAGYFADSQFKKWNEKERHAWAWDRERKLYIDLTMDQFGKYDRVTILPESVPILTQTFQFTAELEQIFEDIARKNKSDFDQLQEAYCA